MVISDYQTIMSPLVGFTGGRYACLLQKAIGNLLIFPRIKNKQ